ncbi:MAG: hypothetical protein ACLT98_15405 [Eggerthellaceae bacterium]
MDGFGLANRARNTISQARTPCLDGCSPPVRGPSSGIGRATAGRWATPRWDTSTSAPGAWCSGLTHINRACRRFAGGEPIAEQASRRRTARRRYTAGARLRRRRPFLSEHALARAAAACIVVHCFMDGRDVPPKSGAGYLDELEGVLAELTDEGCTAEIGSISGRYYAMDRDNRWERVEQAWRAVVAAEPRADATAAEVMAASYAVDVTDEFVAPTALTGRGVRDGDAVVFFNFRPDRAREITRAGGPRSRASIAARTRR